MRRLIAVLAWVFALAAGLGGAPAASAAGAGPFTTLAPGFTQELYATGLPFAFGIAFASNGDPVATLGSMYRVDSHSTVTMNGSSVHPVTSLGGNWGIGLANGANGDIYSNACPVTRFDPTTLAVKGTAQNAPCGDLGIINDPQTSNLVYEGGSGVSYVSQDLATSGTFSANSNPDGIAFDPTGNFLFTSDGGGLTILNRMGTVVQHIDLNGSCCTDGIAFHAGTPKFVLSNNTDGTMTRFDFPNDDYTQVPSQSIFASGGFRGDLTQVGNDGCLYLSQGGTRFADGTTTGEGSMVRICGGFVPPVPVKTTLVAHPSIVNVLPSLNLYLTLSATLTNGGKGIAGEPVTFSAGGKFVCSAKTDATGTASCGGIIPGVLSSVLSLGYQANFAGDGALQPSSAKGNLVSLNGMKLL